MAKQAAWLMEIPHPPDAYWANVPWWAALGFMLTAMVIALVIAPWVVGYSRSKPSALQSRETALLAREAIIDRQRVTYVTDLTSERDRIVGRLRITEDDRDTGWDLARGAELMLHQLHHDLSDMIEQRNSAWTLLHRMATGNLRPEVAAELVNEHPPIPKPKPLPKLLQIERKKPGETPYAES